MHFNSGQRIAVVGKNGIGKTTIIKLICGLYKPTGGKILINGVNIENLKKLPDFSTVFATAFQNFLIIPESIKENIILGKRYTDDKFWESLKDSRLYDKIKSLPLMEHTHLIKMQNDDGIELSGGETQKLLLSRVLYKNSPIIILDEPTSALDAIAEYQLYNDSSQLITRWTTG